jgi:hypothetical protein
MFPFFSFVSGPTERPEHDQRVGQNEARAGKARGRSNDGRKNQCICLSRVLGQDQGGRARGLRDSHQGGVAGQEEEEEAVCSLLNS